MSMENVTWQMMEKRQRLAQQMERLSELGFDSLEAAVDALEGRAGRVHTQVFIGYPSKAGDEALDIQLHGDESGGLRDRRRMS